MEGKGKGQIPIFRTVWFHFSLEKISILGAAFSSAFCVVSVTTHVHPYLTLNLVLPRRLPKIGNPFPSPETRKSFHVLLYYSDVHLTYLDSIFVLLWFVNRRVATLLEILSYQQLVPYLPDGVKSADAIT